MKTLSPNQAKYRIEEAEGYLGLELWVEAEERLDTVERSGHLPLACAILRGNLHMLRDEFADAIPRFEAALRHEPGNVSATFGLGWCFKRVGRPDAAARAYEAALTHHPSEPLLHYNLACYLSLAGDAKRALASLGNAVELDPEFRSKAVEDADFDAIRDLPAFAELTLKQQ